jgi:hypothetical protein
MSEKKRPFRKPSPRDEAQAEQILQEKNVSFNVSSGPPTKPESCVICGATRALTPPGSGKDINNKWICANCRSLI